MKTNVKKKTPQIQTHNGGPAVHVNAEQQLRRSLLSCMLFEDEFYEDGQSIAERIAEACAVLPPHVVGALAVEARNKFNLRHAPLILLLDLVKRGGEGVSKFITDTIQRVDEIPELIALYHKMNKPKSAMKGAPLTRQLKRGLAGAFEKFDEYQLAKYDREGAVTLFDALNLCHVKPKNKTRGDLYKRLLDGKLAKPNTWESRMAGGEKKVDVFTDLLKNNQLGYMALLRNLRGMDQAGVDHALIKQALRTGNHSRVLPYRFIAAARHAPMFEPVLDEAMQEALKEMPKLPGKTKILLDVSGSMDQALSSKSELRRCDAAAGLAILLVGICEEARVFIFGDTVREVAARKGMALRDLVEAKNENTYLGAAVDSMNLVEGDRLIVLTDEQSTDRVAAPKGRGYMINVASARNGVGYRQWVHVDGMSEAVVAFIQEYEKNLIKKQ